MQGHSFTQSSFVFVIIAINNLNEIIQLIYYQLEVQYMAKFDRLFNIEKVIKITEKNGIKYGVIKWENFSYKDLTKQPLDELRKIPCLAEDLTRLEIQFEMNKIKKHLQKYLNLLRDSEMNKLFEDGKRANSESFKSSLTTIENKLSIEERAKCKEMIREEMKKRIKFGLRNLTTRDYFILLRMKLKTEETFNWLNACGKIPKSDKLVKQIKGLVKQGDTFRVIVVLSNSQVKSCIEQQMLLYFPSNWLIYLLNLTSSVKQILQSQILNQQKTLKSQNYKQQSIRSIKKIINIKQKIEQEENQIYFGYSIDEINDYREKEYSLYKNNSISMQEKLKKQENNFIEEYERNIAKELRKIKVDVINEGAKESNSRERGSRRSYSSIQQSSQSKSRDQLKTKSPKKHKSFQSKDDDEQYQITTRRSKKKSIKSNL